MLSYNAGLSDITLTYRLLYVKVTRYKAAGICSEMTARSGEGGKTRLVPVHPELHGTLSSALAYGDISPGQNRRGASHDRMALGEDGGETR